ncbi:DUF6986 family protein [Jatrophihabitans sp. YIM 134969]
MATDDVLTALDAALAADDAERQERYPGPPAGRQPLHTVYVPADTVDADVVVSWGTRALAALEEHGPLPGALVEHTGRVVAKLRREPVEDLRVDLEDGYGLRDDDEEDAHTAAAAGAIAAMVAAGTAPPFTGLRIKSLEPSTRRRAVRTLELFLDRLGPPPPGFRVTLPKVTSVAQVAAFVDVLDAFDPGLRFEIQVETPQAVLGADGRALVAPMLHAARGRCAGLHYGTYDYSASLGVGAPYQAMDHAVADHATSVMQLAAAGTGVPVSHGSTNVLPVGSTADVRAAWALHARLVRRSLERGIYQGWDLHPAQLPTRYAATIAFYRDSAAAVAARLAGYLGKAASGLLDEPATAAAMAGFLCRALDAGAVDTDEVVTATGVPVADLLVLARRSQPPDSSLTGG